MKTAEGERLCSDGGAFVAVLYVGPFDIAGRPKVLDQEAMVTRFLHCEHQRHRGAPPPSVPVNAGACGPAGRGG